MHSRRVSTCTNAGMESESSRSSLMALASPTSSPQAVSTPISALTRVAVSGTSETTLGLPTSLVSTNSRSISRRLGVKGGLVARTRATKVFGAVSRSNPNVVLTVASSISPGSSVSNDSTGFLSSSWTLSHDVTGLGRDHLSLWLGIAPQEASGFFGKGLSGRHFLIVLEGGVGCCWSASREQLGSVSVLCESSHSGLLPSPLVLFNRFARFFAVFVGASRVRSSFTTPALPLPSFVSKRDFFFGTRVKSWLSGVFLAFFRPVCARVLFSPLGVAEATVSPLVLPLVLVLGLVGCNTPAR
mmetsp:Transcript_6803/g.15061  ORF Transcript_6803/g.15061 Transcript_6803/m.15061 type:complete len:300 (-) Transcript_6803:1122-2021(-)